MLIWLWDFPLWCGVHQWRVWGKYVPSPSHQTAQHTKDPKTTLLGNDCGKLQGQKEGKAIVFWPASMTPASSLLPGQVTQKPDRQLPAETGCGATGNHRTLIHWKKKKKKGKRSRENSKAFYFYHDEKVSSCSSNECEHTHFRERLIVFAP